MDRLQLSRQSFAPLGLGYLALLPTAYAVGCILAPLCGWKWQAVFHRVGGISVLGHALRQRNWEVQQLVRIRDFSKAPANRIFPEF